MSTLRDIRKAAESATALNTDGTTPPGHFTATTKVLGVVTTYLLHGQEGDPHAPIVGRIESPGLGRLDQPPSAYRGSGLKGGQYLGGTLVSDSITAFTLMTL